MRRLARHPFLAGGRKSLDSHAFISASVWKLWAFLRSCCRVGPGGRLAASANCEAAIWRSSSMLKYVAGRGTLLIQILPGCSRAPALPPAQGSNNFITTRGLSVRAPTEKTSLIICVEQNCVTGTGNCRCARRPASGTVARQRIGKSFGTEIRPPICDQSCGHDDIAKKPAGLADPWRGRPAFQASLRTSVAWSRSRTGFRARVSRHRLRLWGCPHAAPWELEQLLNPVCCGCSENLGVAGAGQSRPLPGCHLRFSLGGDGDGYEKDRDVGGNSGRLICRAGSVDHQREAA